MGQLRLSASGTSVQRTCEVSARGGDQLVVEPGGGVLGACVALACHEPPEGRENGLGALMRPMPCGRADDQRKVLCSCDEQQPMMKREEGTVRGSCPDSRGGDVRSGRAGDRCRLGER